MKKILIIILLSLFLISSCEIDQHQMMREGELFQFKVEVLNSPDTSADNPSEIKYKDGEFEVEIKITALDYYGDVVKELESNVRVLTSSGKTNPSYIRASEFVDGEITLTTSLLRTYGESYIVVQDSTGNIGISNENFFFKELKIYDLQLPQNDSLAATNHYNDSYVRVSQNVVNGKSKKNLIVIEASGSGMYIADTDKFDVDGAESDDDGVTTGDNTGACMIKENGAWVKNPNFVGYSTVFVYSRNAPINYAGDTTVGAGQEEFSYIKSGHKVDWFSGNLVEFPPGLPDGMTELGFPLWEMVDKEMEKDEATLEARMKHIPVCPLEHSDFVTKGGDDNKIKVMERYESNLVSIKDVVIGDFDANNKDYKIYSQWQVYPQGTDLNTTEEKPTFRVVSIIGASEFDLLFEEGKIDKGTKIAEIKGILHHVYSNLWVIYLRSKCDIRLKDDNIGVGDSAEDPKWNDIFKSIDGKDPECK